MTPLQYLKFLLFPLSFLYGLIIYIRNLLYDHDLLKSIEFDFPIICIGNLSYGGTGKTPHIEYLIRLLSSQFRVATLSRGYKRKTTGYILADAKSEAEQVGDEPALLKKKFPHVAVIVAENRSIAIPQILSSLPETDVILLDDAFQHRSIRPGLSIVLTKYSNLFTKDYILPVGTLREFRNAYQRADFIIVTKCPPDLSEQKRKEVVQEINPAKGQLVFFSFVNYHPAYLITDYKQKVTANKQLDIYLFTGIASTSELTDFLKEHMGNVYTMNFSDHHYFDRVDMENVTEAFHNIDSKNKIMLTTEKDAVRLYEHKQWILSKKLPIYVLPITVDFFEEDKKLFDSEVIGYLTRLKNSR